MHPNMLDGPDLSTSMESPAKILVVDDEERDAKLVRKLLSRDQRHVVRVAHDGPSAVAIADTWGPDLVLLDIMMPQMDGFEVCRQLRQNLSTSDVHIIMLTGKDDMPAKQRGFEAGADDYIIKPFHPTELELRIRAHLRRRYVSTPPVLQLPVWVNQVPLPLILTKRRSGIFRHSHRITKRLFDMVVCLLAAPFVIIIALLIALAVRIDSPGPIIFVQKRTGLYGHPFRMYKFRTMFRDAEEMKAQYADLNELSWPDFKIADDPRVTRVGRLLRRTSLDELPQLLNVLVGQMSLVGPRPTSFASDTYQLWQTERLEVLPGMTGLWQITGRSEIDFKERAELDIEYIERQSWRLDLEILFRTISAVILGRGAS